MVTAVVTAMVHAGAAAVLLAGAAKLQRPGPTRTALSQAGLQVSRSAVTVLGLAEISVAALVLLAGGGTPAAALAVLYGCFAAFVAARLRSDAGATCGCFGSTVELTPLHALLDTVLAAVAAAAAVPAWTGAAVAGLPALVAEDPVAGGLTAALTAAAAALLRMIMTGGAAALSGSAAPARRAAAP